MVLTARYRVHAASQDAEGRYHVAMVPVEGSDENTEAFAGTPGGLMRIGPLHADAGKHFTEGAEVLVDFEVLEPDIEEHEDAPAAPAPESAPAPAVDPTPEPAATAGEPAAPEQDAPNPGTAGVYPYMNPATYTPPPLSGTAYNDAGPAPGEPEEPGNPS